MKAKSRYIVILGMLFGYILLQFTWWEILLVKQAGQIVNEEQKLVELTSTNVTKLQNDIEALHRRKTMQIIMIAGEGTVFLLLLLFGVYKVKQAIDKEARLSRQQNNFFLSITHELKTPITATKLQLQTLQKQALDLAAQKELIAKALLETERLNLLIDNVLLASSLDNGGFSFHLEKCNLGEEVNKTAQRYYNKEIKNGELIINAARNSYVMLDRHAFPSVFTNLVDNAIKYSDPGHKIEVDVKEHENHILFIVRDNGHGIDNSDKKNIFVRFYRAGNEETRNSKGTGLGLFIVRYILNGHHAKIKVKDNKPRGSIFEIEFDAV